MNATSDRETSERCPYCQQQVAGQFKAATLESVEAGFAQLETHERQRTQRDEFKARIDAALALHQPDEAGNCIECSDQVDSRVGHPCATVKILKGTL